MDTIIVRPRNQKELKLINTFLRGLDIQSKVVSGEKFRKRKAKEAFLNSIPERLKEVELHLQGKIELPTWDEVVKEL
jgi:hypothetical protein